MLKHDSHGEEFNAAWTAFCWLALRVAGGAVLIGLGFAVSLWVRLEWGW